MQEKGQRIRRRHLQREAPGKTSFEYKEVCFITGEPIVFEGTLTIRKTLRQDKTTGKNVITANYTYNLRNLEKTPH